MGIPGGIPVILAVDDMPMNLRVIKVYLEKGFVVIPVKSAAEALVILKTKSIDIILLDIEMPGMSGFEFIQEMKKLPAPKKDVPVICVTGLDPTPEFITQVISAGAKDFITKPFEPDVLKTKICKILNINEHVL
ncbi:MAG: response regulator [Spirochaetaceae bacterium]|jgi:putative two-component system response regulator|nr:response regulator [Spirochaetaceae bacterium]